MPTSVSALELKLDFDVQPLKGHLIWRTYGIAKAMP
jgi:hypothetical protein